MQMYVYMHISMFKDVCGCICNIIFMRISVCFCIYIHRCMCIMIIKIICISIYKCMIAGQAIILHIYIYVGVCI